MQQGIQRGTREPGVSAAHRWSRIGKAEQPHRPEKVGASGLVERPGTLSTRWHSEQTARASLRPCPALRTSCACALPAAAIIAAKMMRTPDARLINLFIRFRSWVWDPGAEGDREPGQQPTGADFGERPLAHARRDGEFGARPSRSPWPARSTGRPSSSASPRAGARTACFPALVCHRALPRPRASNLGDMLHEAETRWRESCVM